MPRRMPWRFDQTHGAILEEIAIAFQFKDFKLSDVTKIVLAINRPRPRIRPERVPNFLSLHDVNCPWEVRHAACVIEM